MSKEQDNKAIVGRWFDGFWGIPWNPDTIEKFAALDMLLHYSLHKPHRFSNRKRRGLLFCRIGRLGGSGLPTWHERRAKWSELRGTGGQIWLLADSGVTRLR